MRAAGTPHRSLIRKRDRPARPHTRRKRVLLTGMGSLVLLLALESIFSASASAFAPLEAIEKGIEIVGIPGLPGIGGIGGILGGGGGGGVSGVVGEVAGSALASGAVSAFKSILEFLFGGIEATLTLSTLSVLVHVSLNTDGAVASLYNVTSGIAIAALGGIMTLSVFRYWIAGLTGADDTFSAAKGITRSIGTVCFILMWPWIFLQLQGIVNHVDSAILLSPAVKGDIGALFRATGVGNPFALATGPGMIVNIIVAILFVILIFGLFLLKIVATYSVGVTYVAMPLGVILWPIEELAWIPKLIARVLGLALLIPMVWTLVFATWGAIGDNAINFRGSLGQALLQPLVTIAMLWMAVFLPHSLVRMAKHGMGGGGGGGGAGRTISMTASRMISRQAEGYMASTGILPFGPEGRVTEQRRAAQRRSERTEARAESRTEREAERRTRRKPDSSSGGSGKVDSGKGGTEKSSGKRAKKAAKAGGTAAATGGTGTGAQAAKAGAAGASQGKRPKAGPTPQNGQQAKKTPSTPSRQPATTPSISATRPSNPHPNIGQVAPSKDQVPRDVNKEASGKARGMKASTHASIESWQKLGPAAQKAVSDSAAKATTISDLGNTLARWSTSDQISNRQSNDLLTLSSACHEAGKRGQDKLDDKIGIRATGPGSAAARKIPTTPAKQPPSGEPAKPTNPSNGTNGSKGSPPVKVPIVQQPPS